MNVSYYKFILSFIIVISLILILWVIIKKSFLSKFLITGNENLKYSYHFLDNKNKIAIINMNNKKYVVLLGSNNILLDIINE